MSTFTPLDYAAILVYAGGLLLIGYLSSRRETTEGFLISDRKMSLLGAISTINASKTGSILLLYVAALYVSLISFSEPLTSYEGHQTSE